MHSSPHAQQTINIISLTANAKLCHLSFIPLVSVPSAIWDTQTSRGEKSPVIARSPQLLLAAFGRQTSRPAYTWPWGKWQLIKLCITCFICFGKVKESVIFLTTAYANLGASSNSVLLLVLMDVCKKIYKPVKCCDVAVTPDNDGLIYFLKGVLDIDYLAVSGSNDQEIKRKYTLLGWWFGIYI